MWDECDQLCFNTINSYTCACRANFTLQADSGHCKDLTGDQAKVIFSFGTRLIETDQSGQNVRTILASDELDIGAFDYNYAKRVFYLADDKSNKIYKGVYDASGFMRLTPLITTNIIGPFALSVDWTTDKLYLVQKSIGRIDVFTANGLNRTGLITSNIFTPTCIALDTNSSFMFFADIGNTNNRLQKPKIERASMDGTIRQVNLGS